MQQIRLGNLDNQAVGGEQESLATGEEKTPLGVASSLVPDGRDHSIGSNTMTQETISSVYYGH